ncbi:MAG: sodium:proton antiporter [Pseudomonadota bacterium]|nr:sodium:proton antiporter [Pseudomonadota bacterium]
MTIFQTIAILLTIAALGAYINKKILKLPAAIGLMLFALAISLGALGLAGLGWIDLGPTSAFVAHIDFSGILLHGMLSFLLFAGAMHVDLGELKKYRALVAILATIGVALATFVTGTLVWMAAKALGFPFPYISALLFGALIAPTDPVAVISILSGGGMPKTLQVKIASESLLNDGVGVVTFLAILAFARNPQISGTGAVDIALLLAWQGVGGFALGLALGWLTYQLLHTVDDYKVEVLLTLALAAGGYSLAEFVDVSAPIAMVVAGLVLGNHNDSFGLSPKVRKQLDMFWELLDEILNAILFMLIGLEMVVIPIQAPQLAAGLAAIIAVLIGRFVSVGLPVALMRLRYIFERGTIRLLTWGGLRGGISIAMALSLPPGDQKDLILNMTYMVVVFSVLFQGTTFRHVVRAIIPETPADM